MKIFVNARFLTQPISGVQRYGIECSRQILQQHPDVVFVAPPGILHSDIAKELNVQIIGKRTGHAWEQLDLPRYLAQHDLPPLLNLANTAPLRYHKNFITIHDLAFHFHPEWNSRAFSAWYNILLPRLARKSKHVFTVSQTVKNELLSAYQLLPSKVSVAYNGISQKMLQQGRVVRPKEKIILSVGSFNIRKNHQNLVSGFLDSGLYKDYTLVLIGDKNKVFKDAGINDRTLREANIKIYHTLAENELINMYQRAEILASVSLYEGFGIPILEAIYNGCKVICSDIPVYKELYSRNAFFCSPKDISSIAKTISMTANTDLTDERLKIADDYSYKKSAQAILEQILYNNQ